MENEVSAQPNEPDSLKQPERPRWSIATKMIIVWGLISLASWLFYFHYYSDIYKLAEVPDIESGKIPGWQTYRSEEYGFEFQYPSSLLLEHSVGEQAHTPETDNSASFRSQTGNIIRMTVVDNPDGMDLLNYLKAADTRGQQEEGTSEFGYPAINFELVKNLKVAGAPAVSFPSPHISKSQTWITGDKKFIVFSTIQFTDNSEDPDLALQQILSTFKFNEVKHIGWKTYRNEQFGFELAFPPRWIEMKTVNKADDYYGGYFVHFQLPFEQGHEFGAICFISAHPEMSWQKFQSDDTTGKPIFLKQRGDLIFGWGCGHEDLGYKGFEEYNASIISGKGTTSIAGPYSEFQKLILPTFKLIN